MATDTVIHSPDPRIYNGAARTTGQKTITTAFRIFETQHEALKASYAGNASALIRMLIQKYLDGELVEIENEFHQLLNKQGV